MAAYKTYKTLWLTGIKDGTLGIVGVQDEFGIKYYLGNCAPHETEDGDIKNIAEWGAPVYPEHIKEFFNL